MCPKLQPIRAQSVVQLVVTIWFLAFGGGMAFDVLKEVNFARGSRPLLLAARLWTMIVAVFIHGVVRL